MSQVGLEAMAPYFEKQKTARGLDRAANFSAIKAKHE